MEKKCLTCRKETYIRILQNGEVGRVCEECQKEIMRLAGAGLLGWLENNFSKVKLSIDLEGG